MNDHKHTHIHLTQNLIHSHIQCIKAAHRLRSGPDKKAEWTSDRLRDADAICNMYSIICIWFVVFVWIHFLKTTNEYHIRTHPKTARIVRSAYWNSANPGERLFASLSKPYIRFVMRVVFAHISMLFFFCSKSSHHSKCFSHPSIYYIYVYIDFYACLDFSYVCEQS